MSFFGRVRDRVKRLFSFKLRRKGGYAIGIYGAPNAGKTMLANRMCEDWDAGSMGSVSEVAHETRAVERKTLVLKDSDDGELRIEVMDTPGLASSVSPLDLEMMWDVPPEEARRRAKEATEGILEAIHNLETINGMLLVVDGSKDPHSQVNETLVAHVRARNLAHVVVANKMDLPEFNLAAIQKAFPRSIIVPVSALERKNLQTLYDTLLRVFG